MSAVGHPNEGGLLRQHDLEELKVRGVSSVGLVVSDGLSSNQPNTAYFTYLNYPISIQGMVCNWIERLNRDYKSVLKMMGVMSSPESVLFLMGAVSMEKENKSYEFPVSAFREVAELKRIMKQ